MPEHSLEIFPWNENFATGIDAIDEQHRNLIHLLNQLVGHLAYQSDSPALNTVFDELQRYAAIHFAAEEAIWQTYLGDDAWTTSHHSTHSDFVGEVMRLKAEDQIKPLDDVIEDIVKFLTHWLALHILESDKRMAKAVLFIQSGTPVQQAKLLANEEMTGAVKLMINTVMSMYDKLANSTVRLTREINARKKSEAELRLAKHHAENANRAKSAFLANMSHEIRTPLNAIIGMAHIMKREGLSLPQEQRLNKIDQAGKHLLGVISDILDLSKIEAEKLQLEEKPLSIETVLANVIAMLTPRVHEKNLKLLVNTATLPSNLLGDATRLQQAIINFANNAIKFTEQGSITLSTQKIDENAQSVLIRFDIEDTGIGIEAQTLERLFQAFEQADISTTKKYGGTGLGLAINKKLAELMGGTVGVSSKPGAGSHFWFTARLNKGAHVELEVTLQDVAMAEEQLRKYHSGARILVAEDEPVNREITTYLLESAGLVVDQAEDGAHALEAIQQHPYALILMDMQMPVLNGIEATRKIKTQLGPDCPPILALSASNFADDRQRCLTAGMSDFITKPIAPKALYETLSKWLISPR